MKLQQDERFRSQRASLSLRFTCEDCALFDPDHESCSHGFPTTEHRLSFYEDPEAPLVFCKDFELR